MPVIERLHQDHIHIARLLDFIEREVAKAGTAEPPDYTLLRDVMYYMTHYPDVFHHPREDAIFEHLGARDPAAAREVDAMCAQHEEILARGSDFYRIIGAVMAESIVLVDDFVALARAYVELQRAHLNHEEGVIFPLARRLLPPHEWAEIDAAFEVPDDPVFARPLAGMYERLRRELA